MSRQTLTRWAIVVLLVVCLLALAGCRAQETPADMVPTAAAQAEDTPSDDPALAQVEAPQIQPEMGSPLVETRDVTLYFRMQGENMLAPETRRLQFPTDKKEEEVILEALLAGPSPSLLELQNVFGSGVRVVNCWSNGNMLTVQLNRAFLTAPSDVPNTWAQENYWSQEVFLRRQLGLAAIVNTITEATIYTTVQFYVLDSDEDSTGRRPYRSEIYEGVTDTSLLEPMKRSEHFLLTHFNTAEILMQSWKGRDYDRLYRFVAREVETRPSDATFEQEMAYIDKSLTSYQLTAGTVSAGGQHAVVVAAYQYISGGDSILLNNHPLHLVRERGIWKITYNELLRLMEAL